MTAPRIQHAGDSALLLELDAVIDPQVNARAIGVARSVASSGLAGVRDVVPTFRSVAVHFDPLVAHAADVIAAMERALDAASPQIDGARIELPVVYGGEEGPDLEDVATTAGLSPAAVVERHAAVEYRAYMLGFLPGFAYLASVDPSIAVSRRETPRVAVAAGSVGIAAAQTGVYPCQSPGGWQIVGRTTTPVFDAARQPPALIAPGDRVRFVPVPRDAPRQIRLEPEQPSDATGSMRTTPPDARVVTVLSPGLFTTVQDEGRWGHQHLGVPVSGAMDACSHRLANVLVGNDAGAATLEVTLAGPELRVETATLLAVAGADLEPALDGVPVPARVPVAARAGSVLRFGRRRSGGRAYVAFAGGIVVPPVLGSRSTHVRTKMGGLDGRPLRAGDRIPLGRPVQASSNVGDARPLPSGGARLRVLPGPQSDDFPSGALEVLTSSRFVVGPDSDRMGYRLRGDRRVPTRTGREMISDATLFGGVQVPASGNPILLMADRPTSGGYPQLVVVIGADLPLAGQLMPGDWVEFELCSMTGALEALSSERAGRGRPPDRR